MLKLTNCGRIIAVNPSDVQESVSADSEAPDIMFICSMVDYGIHTYIEAVRYIFISKICFCVLMLQTADLCCEVKNLERYFCVSFWYVLGSDVSIITIILGVLFFYKT